MANHDVSDCQDNKYANMEGEKQITEMQELTRLGLQRMRDHQDNKVMIGMSAVVDLVTASQGIISDALAACPAASFAWAGVSVFILPVSAKRFLRRTQTK